MTALVGTSTAGNSSGSGITGVVRPTTVPGHLILLDLYWESSVGYAAAQLSFSNGSWLVLDERIQLGGTPDFNLIRLIAPFIGTEGSTFNIAWNATLGTVWRSAILAGYKDLRIDRVLNTAGAVIVPFASQAGAASDTTAIAPSVTTTVEQALLAYEEANLGSAALSAYSSPLVERVAFAEMVHASGLQEALGASGAKQATLSAANWWAAGLAAYEGYGNMIQPGTPVWDFPHPPLQVR